MAVDHLTVKAMKNIMPINLILRREIKFILLS